MSEPFKVLDLFCGQFGWSQEFAARGWKCVGIDLVAPNVVPAGCIFTRRDVLTITAAEISDFDFVCASSPCEQFSLFGMKHFHPNPPYPEIGLKLFDHTRLICEKSGVPYVMENVRAAQQFVGKAVHHCGPFYLWGNAVPALMPQGISKNIKMGSSKVIKQLTGKDRTKYRDEHTHLARIGWSGSKERAAATARFATIPPELSKCVADYAERIVGQRILEAENVD